MPKKAKKAKLKAIAGWLDTFGFEESMSMLDELATRHALNGGATGLRIAELIAKQDYESLLKLDLHVTRDDWNISHLVECRQALAFYQKFEPLPVEPEKEAVAYNAFLLSEIQCQRTNSFFRALKAGKINFMPRLAVQLDSAKRKIARVLGKCPSIAELHLAFGPGSTTSIKKRMANPQQKLAEQPQCSELLFHSGYLPSLVREMPHWLHCHSAVVAEDEESATYDLGVIIAPGSLQFVPKKC